MKNLTFNIKKSLFNKVLLTIGLCFISAAITSNIFMSNHVDHLLKDASDKSSLQFSREVVAKVRHELSNAETLVISLATITNMFPKDKTTLVHLLPKIISPAGTKSLVVGGGIWPEPYAFDEQLKKSSLFWGKNSLGKLVLFDNYNKQGSLSYHNEDWYTSAKQLPINQFYWSSSYTDPYTLQQMLTVSAPIWKDNTFFGISTIDLNLDTLIKVIEDSARSLGGQAFLVDKSGHFISTSDMDFTQNNLDQNNELSFNLLNKNNKQFIRSLNIEKPHKAAGDLNKAAHDTTFFDVHNDATGTTSRITLFYMHDTQWTLGLITPKQLMTAPIALFLQQTVIAQSIIVVVFTTLIFLSLNKLIRKPLLSLQSQLNNDNPVLSYPNRDDELGVFTERFNQRYTQLKDSKEKLRETSVYLQRALDSAHAGTISLDIASQTMEWDDKTSLIFGLPNVETCDKYEALIKHIHPDDHDEVLRLFQEAFATPSTSDFETEYRIVLQNGGIRWIKASTNISRDSSGYAIRYNGLIFDLTEQKASEQAVLAKEMADKSNRLKSEFLAHMSHELRTPMHGILSFADFGIKKHDTATREKLLQYFQHIQTSGQRLLGLLNNLLDLSKVEAGKMVLNKQASDFNLIIDTCYQEQKQRLIDANIDLKITKAQTKLLANIDELRITQVICNLLSNSIKFSPNGSVIHISTDQNDQKQLTFMISNQGAPIPAKDVESIFDPFIQSNQPPSDNKGTGLGLAISREFIEAHQGKIWAEANKKDGATFKFTLPME